MAEDFAGGIGAGIGAAAAVGAEAEDVYGPSWITRMVNNAGGLRLEYTPELLDKVIARLDAFCKAVAIKHKRIREMQFLARGLSEDWQSQSYLQTHRDGLDDLAAKHRKLLDVSQKLLERHEAAKKTLDTTEDANVENLRKQQSGIESQ